MTDRDWDQAAARLVQEAERGQWDAAVAGLTRDAEDTAARAAAKARYAASPTARMTSVSRMMHAVISANADAVAAGDMDALRRIKDAEAVADTVLADIPPPMATRAVLARGSGSWTHLARIT